MGHYRRASAKLIKLWGRSVRNFGFLCETENNLWKPRIFQLLVNDHNTDESVHFVNEIVSNNGSSEDGFVLIEILSALLVLAIAVITFLYVSRDTIYHTQNANEYEQAYDLAQSMFNYEQYKRFPDYRIVTGIHGGRFGDTEDALQFLKEDKQAFGNLSNVTIIDARGLSKEQIRKLLLENEDTTIAAFCYSEATCR